MIIRLILPALLGFAIVGCGPKSKVAKVDNSPLSADQWQSLPTDTKYDVQTLERLKAGEPRFADEREWQKYLRTVVIPARKKDLGK